MLVAETARVFFIVGAILADFAVQLGFDFLPELGDGGFKWAGVVGDFAVLRAPAHSVKAV